MKIELTPITGSSQLVGLGYDPETQTMRVRFADYYHKGNRVTVPGAHYDVENVSPEEFEALKSAKSKGAHWHKSIKGKFTITKVQP